MQVQSTWNWRVCNAGVPGPGSEEDTAMPAGAAQAGHKTARPHRLHGGQGSKPQGPAWVPHHLLATCVNECHVRGLQSHVPAVLFCCILHTPCQIMTYFCCKVPGACSTY